MEVHTYCQWMALKRSMSGLRLCVLSSVIGSMGALAYGFEPGAITLENPGLRMLSTPEEPRLRSYFKTFDLNSSLVEARQGFKNSFLKPKSESTSSDPQFAVVKNAMPEFVEIVGSQSLSESSKSTHANSAPDSSQSSHSVTARISTPGAGRVISDPPGIDCLDNCTVVFPPQVNVKLIPIPNSGYAFNGWSGDCQGTGTCESAGVMSVTASFLQVSAAFPSVNVIKDGSGGGYIVGDDFNCGQDCFALFAPNTDLTLVAVPAAGSTFAGWSIPACAQSSVCSFTVDSNKIVSARFDLLPGTLVHHCPNPGLGDLVSSSLPGDVVFVTGFCGENVTIRNNKSRLTLEGAGIASLTGEFLFGDPVLRIRGKGIAVQGFNIVGGFDGIVVERNANAVINNNYIRNARSSGVLVEQAGFAVITNNLISSNQGPGIMVTENASARIGFNDDSDVGAAANVVDSNVFGVVVNGGSSARVVGNFIFQNSNDGIAVTRSSHADIADNLLAGNGGNGINVADNSTVQLGEDTGTTIYATPNASTVPNLGFAIKCNAGSVLDGRIGTLAGSAGGKSIGASCMDGLSP